jgi:hypothetical protein
MDLTSRPRQHHQGDSGLAKVQRGECARHHAEHLHHLPHRKHSRDAIHVLAHHLPDEAVNRGCYAEPDK